MSEQLSKESGRVLAVVFIWAYKHGIEVTLRSNREYDGHRWPVLLFRRGDNRIEHAFWPLTDLEGQAKYAWESIAHKLLVEPLDLTYVTAQESDE